MPGARADAARWTNASGHFWLRGGFGSDGRDIECYLNDLWEFDPSQAQWTWMGGNKSCANINDAGWEGIYGQVGVFGAGFIPWSLQSPSTWTDSSGNLWLFGGIGEDTGGVGSYLNDMWIYDPALKQWAWTNANSDSNGNSSLGSYGSLGVFGPSNIPGARFRAASWTDPAGNFWLFGGSGVGTATFGWQNDLWEFKPSINQWAWMGGDTGLSQSGTYGSLETPASGNLPGARIQPATWTDNVGNLWLFGGHGIDAAGAYGYLNDMWQIGLNGSPTVAPPQPTATPALSLASGTYSATEEVSISDASPGATIYYTTNGTYPNSTSSIYSGPITVSSTETLEAIAVASGFTVSPAATATYTITAPVTPSFAITGTSISVNPGAITGNTSIITVTPSGGFTGSVTLTAAVTSSPAGAQYPPTLSFGTTSPVSITGTTAGTATLTINTTASSTSSCTADNRMRRGVPWYAGSGAVLACVFLLAIPQRRRRLWKMLGLLVLLIALSGGVLACGGGGGGGSNCPTPIIPGTTAGTYTVTVTGTSGTLTEIGTVTLTMQ